MRRKRTNASEKSEVERQEGSAIKESGTLPGSAPTGDDFPRRPKKKRALDGNDQDAHPVSDEPLPDDEEELVTSQNPSRRDIDEP
ncbi:MULTISPECIES: hypothetical protein [Mesorhizobium]|uniref:Uncharacterized protein n=1 Tax=Mesorhizobium opportunistum (strain LMG 24607 / HAMBI 3007 / WSM2075) TaxID=536019 RepID=F7Y7M5_MESOW|nr:MULTISPECIES: hypothetical protein [Mesorhizobium]AEH90898.1 conserved hypothetical protein [Mesorhizobium opportunistum WSM2075]TPN51292.1 hypothetical protein FJ978_13230 [Mesorhizobium sp. B1-1-7]TPN56554.1 hypothetical protein FJ976_05860 [Mesorhizobium sp. B1-1-9]